MKSTEGCMPFDGPFLGYFIARVVLTSVCVIRWFWNSIVYILDKRRLNILVLCLINGFFYFVNRFLH